MAGKKAMTSYLVYEPHTRDNSRKNCRSVESILDAVASEKQKNCFICDKCQKSCRLVISILEAVRSEEKQNCSIWDNSYKNCRSVVGILVTLTSEDQQNCSICDKCQKNCLSVVSILVTLTLFPKKFYNLLRISYILLWQKPVALTSYLHLNMNIGKLTCVNFNTHFV